MALSQVDERIELPNANVIAGLEVQQGDSREAECTPNSPAACRAAIVHTLQCGIETARTVAACHPRRECQRRKGHVAPHQQLSASLAHSSPVATARKPVEARPSRAHRGLLRDVTTVPCSSIFAREGRLCNAPQTPACRRRCMGNLVAALLRVLHGPLARICQLPHHPRL